MSQKIKFRLKKGKIKINASLSSICNSLGLIPTKVLAEFTNIADKLEPNEHKFFVELCADETDFTVKLIDNSDAAQLRKFLKTTTEKTKIQQFIRDYAEQTIEKTLNNLQGRISQLKGILRSFNYGF